MLDNHIFERKYFRYALYAIPLLAPLTLLAASDVITIPHSHIFRTLLGALFIVVAYIIGVLVFWWTEILKTRRRHAKSVDKPAGTELASKDLESK